MDTIKVDVHGLIFVFVVPQVIGALKATDKDEQPASFSFSLASESSNFSIGDYGSKSLCALSIDSTFFLMLVALSGAQRRRWPRHLLLCNN